MIARQGQLPFCNGKVERTNRSQEDEERIDNGKIRKIGHGKIRRKVRSQQDKGEN